MTKDHQKSIEKIEVWMSSTNKGKRQASSSPPPADQPQRKKSAVAREDNELHLRRLVPSTQECHDFDNFEGPLRHRDIPRSLTLAEFRAWIEKAFELTEQGFDLGQVFYLHHFSKESIESEEDWQHFLAQYPVDELQEEDANVTFTTTDPEELPDDPAQAINTPSDLQKVAKGAARPKYRIKDLFEEEADEPLRNVPKKRSQKRKVTRHSRDPPENLDEDEPRPTPKPKCKKKNDTEEDNREGGDHTKVNAGVPFDSDVRKTRAAKLPSDAAELLKLYKIGQGQDGVDPPADPDVAAYSRVVMGGSCHRTNAHYRLTTALDRQYGRGAAQQFRGLRANDFPGRFNSQQAVDFLTQNRTNADGIIRSRDEMAQLGMEESLRRSRQAAAAGASPFEHRAALRRSTGKPRKPAKSSAENNESRSETAAGTNHPSQARPEPTPQPPTSEVADFLDRPKQTPVRRSGRATVPTLRLRGHEVSRSNASEQTIDDGGQEDDEDSQAGHAEQDTTDDSPKGNGPQGRPSPTITPGERMRQILHRALDRAGYSGERKRRAFATVDREAKVETASVDKNGHWNHKRREKATTAGNEAYRQAQADHENESNSPRESRQQQSRPAVFTEAHPADTSHGAAPTRINHPVHNEPANEAGVSASPPRSPPPRQDLGPNHPSALSMHELANLLQYANHAAEADDQEDEEREE